MKKIKITSDRFSRCRECEETIYPDEDCFYFPDEPDNKKKTGCMQCFEYKEAYKNLLEQKNIVAKIMEKDLLEAKLLQDKIAKEVK